MNKVSIILTTYNSEAHLKSTLESICVQDYPEIEVIICDGGSKDRTLEIIQNFESNSNLCIKWKSEPDRGIYDAMNKGYQMSTGSVILFFNDVFSRKDAISLCMNAMEMENCVGAHADLVYINNEKIIRKWKMGQGTIRQGWMPGHPTLFLKREIFEKYGLYKTDYKVAADYEFMVRVLKDGLVKLAYVPETIVHMFYGGTSTQGMDGYMISLKEGHRALKENGVKNACIIDVRRTFRVLRQFVSC